MRVSILLVASMEEVRKKCVLGVSSQREYDVRIGSENVIKSTEVSKRVDLELLKAALNWSVP